MDKWLEKKVSIGKTIGFIAAFFDAVRQEKPDRSGLVDNRITIFYISPKSLQVVKPGSASVE